MTTCTPLFGLPVVEGSDRPCDIDQWSCDFASAVESQLDTLDGIVQRTATTVPMAKVISTVPVTFGNETTSGSTPNLSFDTVAVDTDNMFNSSFPEQIFFPTKGMYGMHLNVWATTTGGANQDAFGGSIKLFPGLSGSFSTSLNVAFNGTNFNATTGAIYLSLLGEWPVTVDGSYIVAGTFLFIQSTDTLTITRAEMGAFWMGDLS